MNIDNGMLDIYVKRSDWLDYLQSKIHRNRGRKSLLEFFILLKTGIEIRDDVQLAEDREIYHKLTGELIGWNIKAEVVSEPLVLFNG